MNTIAWVHANCKFAGKGILLLPPELRHWVDSNLESILQKAKQMTGNESAETLQRRKDDRKSFIDQAIPALIPLAENIKEMGEIGERLFWNNLGDENEQNENVKIRKPKDIVIPINLSKNTITIIVSAEGPQNSYKAVKSSSRPDGGKDYKILISARMIMTWKKNTIAERIEEEIRSAAALLAERKVFNYQDEKRPLEVPLGDVNFFNPYDKQQWTCSIFLNRSMKHSQGIQVNESLRNRQIVVRLNANSAAMLGMKFEDVIVHELTHAFDPKTIKNIKNPEEDGSNKSYFLSPMEFDARMAEMHSTLRRGLIQTIQVGGDGKAWLAEQRQKASSMPIKDIIRSLNFITNQGLEYYFSDPKIVEQMGRKYVRSLEVLQREIPLLQMK